MKHRRRSPQLSRSRASSDVRAVGLQPNHPVAGGRQQVLAGIDGRLFAGLAEGQIWESGDRGDSWRVCTLRGDPLRALQALAYANI